MSAQIKSVPRMDKGLIQVNETILALNFTVKLRDLIEEAEAKHCLGIRRWLEAPEGKIYVRVGMRKLEDVDQMVVYLANVEIDQKWRRRGLFNELVRRAEICAVMYSCGLFIENTLDEHLERSLPRHGFKQLPYSVPPSFYKTRVRLREEHAQQMDDFLGLKPVVMPDAR
jgi:hypothetical protein